MESEQKSERGQYMLINFKNFIRKGTQKGGIKEEDVSYKGKG